MYDMPEVLTGMNQKVSELALGLWGLQSKDTRAHRGKTGTCSSGVTKAGRLHGKPVSLLARAKLTARKSRWEYGPRIPEKANAAL